MALTEAPLVPPSRLAALMIERRVEAGLDLAEMAARSDGRFDASSLQAFERGRLPLDEGALDRILELYEIDAGPVVPGRSKLVLDLDRQEIQVGWDSVSFFSPTADAVMERYVSLLYLLRDASPGTPLTLRDDDLRVLGEGLGRHEDRVRDDLTAIMLSDETAARTARLARRRTVLGAGLLVGATALGALVVVSQTLPGSTAARLESPVAIAAPPAEAAVSPLSIAGSLAVPEGVSVETPSLPQERGARLTDPGADVVPALVGADAEALVDYDFRSALPGWSIEFAGDHDRWHGVTNSVTKTITVFVEPGSTPDRVAEVLMHEVGHALDIELMDDDLRRRWVEMRDIPSAWWTGDGLSDFAVGAGDFAEAVAAYTTDSPSRSVYGEFTDEQLAFVAELLAG